MSWLSPFVTCRDFSRPTFEDSSPVRAEVIGWTTDSPLQG